MDTFAQVFGHYPISATNHSDGEGIYWGNQRVSGWRSWVYSLITRRRNVGRFRGHVEGDPFFWGDLCRAKIKYFRNFVFRDINTLKACPIMPYFDPERPYVNYWFASSDGRSVREYADCLCEENQGPAWRPRAAPASCTRISPADSPAAESWNRGFGSS